MNVPKLLEVTRVDNRWALVSEFIEGKTISQLMKENPDKFDHYLDLFVQVQLVVLENKVPMLNRIKEKFKRKLENATNIDDNIKYELLQRLEGMKNHDKLCHGDFHPSNVIVQDDGVVYVIDWSHVTQGNASADAARTYLLFSMDGKEEVAEKYLNLFSEKSGIEKRSVQRWIPIVAATQMTKNVLEEHFGKQKYLQCYEKVCNISVYLDNCITVFKDYDQIKTSYIGILNEVMDYKAETDTEFEYNYMFDFNELSVDFPLYYFSLNNYVSNDYVDEVVSFDLKPISNFNPLVAHH